MKRDIYFDPIVHDACWKAYRKRIWRARLDFCKKHWSLLAIVTGAVALVFWRLSWMN